MARLKIMNVFRFVVYGGDAFVGWLWLVIGEGRMRVTIRAGELGGPLGGSARCLWSCMENDGKEFGNGNVIRHDWKCRKEGRRFELSESGCDGWKAKQFEECRERDGGQ
jgi:hypothetical protein